MRHVGLCVPRWSSMSTDTVWTLRALTKRVSPVTVCAAIDITSAMMAVPPLHWSHSTI